MLRGPQAFEQGMADAMFEPADFLEESLRWAARVLNGEIAVERAPVPENSAADWDAAMATALAVGKKLRKSCVLVKDAPAFVVNRLLTRFLGEIIAAVDEGTPVEVAERAPEPLGLPMSPFLLLQPLGPAIALHVAETLRAPGPAPPPGNRRCRS